MARTTIERVSGSTLDRTILDYLKRDGLLTEGHFAYRSGRHSALHLDRDRLLADPGAASRMGYALAKRFFNDHLHTIASPSIWGAGLAQWVAYFLDPKAKVVYATPHDGQPTIAPRLESLIAGQRVLLIDNLIMSGATMGRFDELITGLGGEVIGIGALWNATEPTIGAEPVFGLLNELYEAFPAASCPLCAARSGEPVEIPY